MLNMYEEVQKRIFLEEDVEHSLVDMKKLMKGFDIQFQYFYHQTKREIKYKDNYEKLMKPLSEAGQGFNSVEMMSGILHTYKSNDMLLVVKAESFDSVKLEAMKDKLELFVRMIIKVEELQAYRAYSFINPFFFEIVRALFSKNETLESVVLELEFLLNAILGVAIKLISFRGANFLTRDSEVEDNIVYEKNELLIEYKIDREVDKLIDRDKVLELVFMTVRRYFEWLSLNKRYDELLNNEVLQYKSDSDYYDLALLYKEISSAKTEKDLSKNLYRLICDKVENDFVLINIDKAYNYGEDSEEYKLYRLDEEIVNGTAYYSLIVKRKMAFSPEEKAYLNIMFHYSKQLIENLELHRRVEELSIQDKLTGLFSQRYFFENMKKEMEKSNRYDKRVTVMLLEIDDYRGFTIEFGGVRAKKELKHLANIVNRSLRNTDVACRYSFEKIAIILPFISSKQGEVVVERIKREIEEKLSVTISVALTEYLKKEEIKEFVERLGGILKEAKLIGGNSFLVK